MNSVDHERIRTGLSKNDLDHKIPQESESPRFENDSERLEAVKRARRHRIGIDETNHQIRSSRPEPTDSIVLGAIIASNDSPLPLSAVATGLRWPPSRVEDAIPNLNQHLLHTGQRLAIFDDGTAEIRPVFDYLEESQTTRTIAASIKNTSLNHQQLGVLYQYVVYRKSRRFFGTKPAQTDPNVRTLLEAGLLIENGSRIEAAPHVRYSLLDEDAELPYSPIGNALAH